MDKRNGNEMNFQAVLSASCSGFRKRRGIRRQSTLSLYGAAEELARTARSSRRVCSLAVKDGIAAAATIVLKGELFDGGDGQACAVLIGGDDSSQTATLASATVGIRAVSSRIFCPSCNLYIQ